MLIMKLLGFVVGTTLLIQLVDKQGMTGNSRAFLIRLSASSLVIIVTIIKAKPLLSTINKLATQTNFNTHYLNLVTKSVATAYLSEMGKDFAIDCGEMTMANRIVTLSKILIMTNTLPVIDDLLKLLTSVFG